MSELIAGVDCGTKFGHSGAHPAVISAVNETVGNGFTVTVIIPVSAWFPHASATTQE
jgi:hypothetical protein